MNVRCANKCYYYYYYFFTKPLYGHIIPMKTWKALSWTMRAVSTDKRPLDYVEIKEQEYEVFTPDRIFYRGLDAHFKMLRVREGGLRETTHVNTVRERTCGKV